MPDIPSNGKHYKFVYLCNYAINASFVIALLTIHWLDLNCQIVKEWLQMGICCMGTAMFLYLWSRAFIADSNYKGPRILDARTTRLLTLALVLIEWMTLYYSAFGHEIFIRPATVCMILWLIVVTFSIAKHRLILQNN